ncbi:MAG: SDR family oxidoreductase [Methylococcales bacterium]
MAKLLIVGCGAIGSALAEQLLALGHQVSAIKRHPPETLTANISYHRADITVPEDLTGLATDFTQIFFIVTADSRSEQGYKAIYQTGLDNLIRHFACAAVKPTWFLVSSTGVYGQNQGEWVDEDSIAEPQQATSQWIRHAEQRLTALAAGNIVLRFSGIYGPGRESLLNMAKRSPVIQKQPSYFTNRIHQEDCIGVLVFLLGKHLAGEALAQYYLASDNDPAPMWQVMSWLAEQLQCPAPTAKTEPGADCNKRCSNRRLRELGYQFKYPDYQAGYRSLLSNS